MTKNQSNCVLLTKCNVFHSTYKNKHTHNFAYTLKNMTSCKSSPIQHSHLLKLNKQMAMKFTKCCNQASATTVHLLSITIDLSITIVHALSSVVSQNGISRISLESMMKNPMIGGSCVQVFHEDGRLRVCDPVSGHVQVYRGGVHSGPEARQNGHVR